MKKTIPFILSLFDNKHFLIRSFISRAAALVKVSINNSSTLIPFLTLVNTLSLNTAVLPLPAHFLIYLGIRYQ